ncbi:MAG TPA: hypothetical protein DF282_11755, partial [Hyphomonas sp.]|nr:hypothetical protein [Hyphomonas sp.]
NHLFNSAIKGSGLEAAVGSLPGRVFGWAVTFFAVCVAWIYFRAENLEAANNVLAGFLGMNGFHMPPHLNALLGLPVK